MRINEKIWRLASELVKGKSIKEATRLAGMSISEAELAISFLIAEGYLVEMGQNYECVCDRCPLRGVCKAPVTFRGKTYAIIRLPDKMDRGIGAGNS